MNYFLTEEQQMIKDLAAQIAKEKIAPVALEYDETGKFPWDIVKVMAEADLFRRVHPRGVRRPGRRHHGDGHRGGGAVQGLRRHRPGLRRHRPGHLPDHPVRQRGAEEEIPAAHRRGQDPGRLRPDRGRTPARDAGGHPDHGRARRRQLHPQRHQAVDHQRRRGRDLHRHRPDRPEPRARAAPRAFIVEKGTPGFTFGKKENKMGIRASATRELVFQDCRVPKANLLGREGHGLHRGDEDLRPVPARASPPRRWASPPGRSTRRSATPASASSSASRSPPSRACSSCWPTWPPRSRPPAPWSTRPPAAIDAGAKDVGQDLGHVPRSSPRTWP